MTRKISLLLVCTAIFISLMPVTTSAGEDELPGLDVYVVGSHAYVPGEKAGFMWLISAGR
jgi:hypothetical protein